MKISEHHGNTALLADVAVRMKDANKPSEALCGSLRSVMRSNLVQQMHLKQILVSAVKLLREHDMEPVLLKGFGLASLYPNPALRQFGDIDLFVGLDNFHPACAVLPCPAATTGARKWTRGGTSISSSVLIPWRCTV